MKLEAIDPGGFPACAGMRGAGTAAGEGSGVIVIASIRELLRAVPFRPFTIYLASGSAWFSVEENYQCSIPLEDDGETVTVYDADGFHIINAIQIERIEVEK